MKEFADDNFRFDENGRMLSKTVENTVEKGEIARHKQFLLFPLFSKDLYCRHVKPGLVWERVDSSAFNIIFSHLIVTVHIFMYFLDLPVLGKSP